MAAGQRVGVAGQKIGHVTLVQHHYKMVIQISHQNLENPLNLSSFQMVSVSSSIEYDIRS